MVQDSKTVIVDVQRTGVGLRKVYSTRSLRAVNRRFVRKRLKITRDISAPFIESLADIRKRAL